MMTVAACTNRNIQSSPDNRSENRYHQLKVLNKWGQGGGSGERVGGGGKASSSPTMEITSLDPTAPV